MNRINNLIIVAHPDDEAIWFSSIVEKKDCVICVCFQNNQNLENNLKYTSKVFEIIEEYREYTSMFWIQTIKTTNPQIFGKIDIRTKDQLQSNLASIISILSPQKIYTHNPYGEYGHSEHKLVHEVLKQHWKNLLHFPIYGMEKDIHSLPMIIEQKNIVDISFREKLFNKYKSRGIWTGSKGEPYGEKDVFLRYK